MPMFDKRFVHFMWDESLKGKSCFVADSIIKLQECVESNDTLFLDTVISEYNGDYPFRMNIGNCFRFCYYDPYYNFKLAYEQGKTIQAKHILTGEWVDMAGKNIDWDNVDGYELRIKPEEPGKSKPVTNRELARWLAQGNGEYYAYDCDGWESYRCIEYQYEKDNLTVSKVMVRKWEDTEWHEPTREYMGLD